MNEIKEEAKKMIDMMPEHITWDDIIYKFYVKKKLELSQKAADEGKVISHDEVKNRFLKS